MYLTLVLGCPFDPNPLGGGGGGAKGRSFTSRRGKGRGPSGGRLAVPRGF